MSLGLADDYTQLAFHVLAHAVWLGPGRLSDPWYDEWSARTFSAGTALQVAEDGYIVGQMGEHPELHLLAELHRSIAAFKPTATRPLADIQPHEVRDVPALRALQRLGTAAELLHASMALVAPEFTAVFIDIIKPWGRAAVAAISPWLAALAEHAPGLADARVELVWPLGRHGRAMPGRILIGCIDPDADPISPAILAMHEHAVCTSGHVDYLPAEWDALRRAARWSAAAPPALRDAHARWLASLDLAPLLARLVAAGLLAPADATRLANPADRADRLRAL